MSDTNLETQVPHEHVVATELDGGEGVLVDMQAKLYYQLNETAMFVWRGLEQGRTPREIIEDMTSAYEVTREHAAASVRRLLDTFTSHKLIRPA